MNINVLILPLNTKLKVIEIKLYPLKQLIQQYQIVCGTENNWFALVNGLSTVFAPLGFISFMNGLSTAFAILGFISLMNGLSTVFEFLGLISLVPVFPLVNGLSSVFATVVRRNVKDLF